jgi:hypothetical protein
LFPQITGNAQRWINTLGSTRDPATKRSLLAVLYANMSHADIVGHLATRPGIVEIFVKVACDT